MPTERLSMRRIRQVLQLHFGARCQRSGDRRDGRHRAEHGAGLSGASGCGRAGLAATAGADGRGAGAASVPGSEQQARCAPLCRTRLVGAGARDEASRGQSVDIVRGISRQFIPRATRTAVSVELYRAFERRLSPTMRQTHVAGDKAFVDYSGKKVPIVDPLTGEVRMAELFIAVLGASNLTYADASWTQSLPDWIGAHVRMFRFFGSAPRLLVPDNLKSGVNKPSFYDPEINRSYGKMAAHYNVGVVPARPRKPKDKAAVEAGVRFAQSYILGRLRNVTFFSLAECNAAIGVALERMNGREMRRLGVSRRQLFETIERPAMQSLPEQDYEYAEWRFARVGIDYHVEVEGFFYSVPHALIREQVDTRITTRTIEVFHRGKRVASHARRYGGPRHGTLPDHMPSAHRRYAEWSAERFARQARDIGPNTEALILAVLARRPHPEQGFRTCLGVLRLFRGLDAARAEAISRRAVEVGVLTYASVASILKHRLDQSAPPQAADGTPLLHENIRGSGYFH